MTWTCEKLEYYLLGRITSFLVETDHKPLQTILNMQNLDQCPTRLQRLKMSMMRYLFHIVYVPRKKLSIADTLSRSPVDKGTSTLSTIVDEHVIHSITSLCQGSDLWQNKICEET